MLNRHAVRQHQNGQERACNHLRCTEDHPARTGKEKGQPMPAAAEILRRQKAQKIDLLANLRHQREDHGRRGTETDEIDTAPATGLGARRLCGRINSGEGQPLTDRLPIGERDEHKGQDVQDDPERLRRELKSADPGDPVRDQRNDGDGTDDIADPERNTERKLQCARHDRGFDRKQDKRETGIDKRRDRRTDVTEACTAGQQVDVDAITHRITADRQADNQQDEAADQNGDKRIRSPVRQGDCTADRFQCQKGNRTDGRLRNRA